MRKHIAIAADHAGVEYKNRLIEYLNDNGYQMINCGTDTTDSVDYPVYAGKVCKLLQNGEAEKGILICGTGIGMCIAANKYKGIRAGCCTSEKMAELSRQHNNANVLCMGERIMEYSIVQKCVITFLETDFLTGGKHEERVGMLDKLLE